MKSIKILLTFFLCIFTLSAFTVTSYANCNGDVDNDNVYSTKDAELTLMYAAGLEAPDAEQETAADIDRDGYIRTEDALEILNIACNLSVAPTHEYTDWYITEDATCTEDGHGYSECFICGEQFHMIIPATGHYPIGQTCTTSGECLFCGETLPATGHNFVDDVCSDCGYSIAKPAVTYNGKSVAFGATTATIEKTLGKPQDVLGDLSKIGTVKIYVYCNDYKNLGVFTFVNDKLIQFYSNNSATKVAQGQNEYSLKRAVLTESPYLEIGDIVVNQYTDKHAEGGMYVYSYLATLDKTYTFYDISDKSATEKLIFHLTNGMRALHHKEPLTYCTTAAKAAYNHSLDMGTRDYFSHTTPEGKSPADRLLAAGLDDLWAYGENIAAGYTDAYEISDGWYNSQGHRENLLIDYYTHLGVGIAYVPGSGYKFYGTQNFYT